MDVEWVGAGTARGGYIASTSARSAFARFGRQRAPGGDGGGG